MTTLAADKPRNYGLGDLEEFSLVASDIIYEGAAVGIVPASGHSRPLASGDLFGGFQERKTDNSAGAAAAKKGKTVMRGLVQLSVSGAVITDINQPVYATDDDTFVFTPVGGTFVGFVARFVSSGVVVVRFDAVGYRDPWAMYTVRELSAATLTLDIEDQGKLIVADTDNTVITLPATATPTNCVVMNIGAYGSVKLSLSPQAADKVQGPNLPGTDNKDLINTKATQKRGDFVRIVTGDANGPIVSELRGTWAQEA